MAAETFDKWYKRECAGVTGFVSGEWLVKGASHAENKLNTNPPRELWPNMVPLARVMQAIRDRLGAPITLTSVYRSPAYNKAIGGALNSLHMQFKAADWMAGAGTPQVWAAAALLLRDEGYFKGGVGLYPDAGFVHVDVRGTNVEWIQDSKGRRPMVRTGVLAPMPFVDPAPPYLAPPPLMTPHPPEPAPKTAPRTGLMAVGIGGVSVGTALVAVSADDAPAEGDTNIGLAVGIGFLLAAAIAVWFVVKRWRK